MNRTNIAVALAALAALVLFAAPAARAQLQIKLGVGVTYTDFSKDPSTGTFSGQAGYAVGGTLVGGETTYFEGGVFYVRKGVQYQNASTSATFDDDIDGVRIPAMIGFHLIAPSEGSSFGVRAFGGGSAFIVTSVNIQGASKDDLTSPTWGVFAGAGLDISMFYVDLAYEWSLTNVSDVSTVDVGQTRSLIATAGIRLGI